MTIFTVEEVRELSEEMKMNYDLLVQILTEQGFYIKGV